MKMIRHAFVLGGFVCCLLFLSLDTAYAQVLSPRSYLFVEVKDTAGQGITDATLTVSDGDGKTIRSARTDKDGLARTEFPPRTDHHYNIQVSKSGYLSSEKVLFTEPGSPDLVEGILNAPRYQALAIVLRKTPIMPEERQTAEAEEQKYQLLLAAKRGDAVSLRKLLQAGVKADTPDAKGVSAIVWAVFAGDTETIKALLAAGANVRKKNTLGHQALLIYLAEGLPRERATRKSESDSQTGLEKDLLEGHEEIVRKLIKAGAGVNERTSNWGTVLNNAIIQVPDFLSSLTVKALIAAGAKVNDVDDTGGRVPLMLAAQTSSLETINMLLKAGASVDAKDKAARTALMWAQTSSAYPGHYNPEIVRALIAARADVNAVDQYGRTPLMAAAAADLLDSVEMLLAAGAKPYINAKDKWGSTALIRAFDSFYYSTKYSVGHPFSAIVKALIAAGANINDADGNGRTPLMLAAQTNSLAAVKMLLEAGAPINTKDKAGRTVLMYDQLTYHFPSLEIIKALIAAGADLHAVDEQGRTPLMLAAQSASIEIVRVLLAAGAKSSINAKDKWGQTALFFTCYASGFSLPAVRGLVAKELIAAGADVNLKDNQGQTALMVARRFQDETVVKLLEEVTRP